MIATKVHAIVLEHAGIACNMIGGLIDTFCCGLGCGI